MCEQIKGPHMECCNPQEQQQEPLGPRGQERKVLRAGAVDKKL